MTDRICGDATVDDPDVAGRDQVQRRLSRLADELTAGGALRTEAWRTAFLATPRHVFVPRFYLLDPGTAAVRRVSTPDPAWLDGAYSNEPLVTQFNDDPAATTGFPTSSSTEPDLMLRMLETLDVRDGHKVLEIGTGTGYNAALLCHRLGDQHVTSIDIDPTLTQAARERLTQLDLHPTVVTGDGAKGYAKNGPYDRLIATCAVRQIPHAWLDQVAPGGTILTTIETSLHGYGLALLAVDDDHHGNGRILDQPASFMPMRSHRDPAFTTLQATAAPATGEPRTSRITISDLDSDDARFILGLALPDTASFATGAEHDGLYLAHHTNHSWAELRADGTVLGGGSDDLWATLEAAHTDWIDAGKPARHQLAISATAHHQTLQLGSAPIWQLSDRS